MHHEQLWKLVALGLASLVCAGCGPKEPNTLDKMATGIVRVGDTPFSVWIARTSEETSRGLMFVTKEEMAPLDDGTERGMLFVFGYDRSTGFWMRNTIVPLDIAFIRSDGTIVNTHTMAPYDERSYPPSEPYRYALEVNANVFSRLGVDRGGPHRNPRVGAKGLSVTRRTPIRGCQTIRAVSPLRHAWTVCASRGCERSENGSTARRSTRRPPGWY